MRRIYLDSRLAKMILLPGYSTITLGPFIFSKSKVIGEHTLVHESIHVAQWVEVTIASLVILAALSWLIGPLWMLAAPIVYYVLYFVEWLIRLFGKGNAYRRLSFEKEAFSNEHTPLYVCERDAFSWVKYLRKGVTK